MLERMIMFLLLMYVNLSSKHFLNPTASIIDREQRPAFTHLNISKPYKENDILWVKHHDTIMNVFDEYIEKYVTSLDCGPDFPFNSSYEEFRMKRYENDGHDQFKDHVDVQDHPTARRMLVICSYT